MACLDARGKKQPQDVLCAHADNMTDHDRRLLISQTVIIVIVVIQTRPMYRRCCQRRRVLCV